MKTVSRILAAAALVAAVSVPAHAQAVGNKIATIRINDIVNEAPQFKAVSEKLKTEFERREKDLDVEVKKFQEDGNNFKKEADVLAAADRTRKEKELVNRQLDLQAKARTLQEEFQRRQQQLVVEAEGRLKSIIEQVAKEKGVSMVVSNAVYASPDVDLTSEILKRLQSAK